LRKARRSEPTGDVKKKLAVVRRAAALAYPTADIEQMIAEVERGRLVT
jgi:hypothetical protein